MSAPRHRFAERHVLLWILAACMLAFVIMFAVMILRQRVAPPAPIKRPVVRYVPPHRASPQQLFAEMLDPSLLALPNLHGYSGTLWQRGATAQHRSLARATELAYLESEPAGDLPELLAQPLLADAVRGQTAKALADPLAWEPTALLAPAATQSVARIEGQLAERLLTRLPALPTILSPSPIRPTHLRLGVSGDGVVRYVALQRSSGWEQADTQALALARQFQFAPRIAHRNEQITWGILRLLWQTETPPAPGPAAN